jgi:hypothetical protein
VAPLLVPGRGARNRRAIRRQYREGAIDVGEVFDSRDAYLAIGHRHERLGIDRHDARPWRLSVHAVQRLGVDHRPLPKLAGDLRHPVFADDVPGFDRECASNVSAKRSGVHLARPALEASRLHDAAARRQRKNVAVESLEQVNEPKARGENDRGTVVVQPLDAGAQPIEVERAPANEERLLARKMISKCAHEEAAHVRKRRVGGFLLRGTNDQDGNGQRQVIHEHRAAERQRSRIVRTDVAHRVGTAHTDRRTARPKRE